MRSTFTVRRLYTAWDNLGDEERFFRGVDTLERHGIHPRNLLVYMLVGYDKRETWERVCHRFNRMVATFGLTPCAQRQHPVPVAVAGAVELL